VALSDFVQINIALNAQSLTLPGFGTPLILGADCPAGFTNRVRTYTNLAGLTTDGFSATGPTYLMATKLLEQNPCPPKFKVGRLANVPTQHFTMTPTAVNSAVYKMKVNGTEVSYTADGTATAAEIVTGLSSAITALSVSGLTVGGTTTLTLSMSAGKFLDVQVEDLSLMSIAQDHSDPGAGADLTAINTEDPDFYCVLNPFNSAAMGAAIATWVEAQGQSNPKIFVAQTNDSDVAIHALSGATDWAASEKTAAHMRTSIWYSPSSGDFLDAAVAGAVLPDDPGSEQWGLKTLSGVASNTPTTTQKTNVLAKNANEYEVLAGVGITNPGKVASGEWIDVVRFRDWLAVTMQGDIMQALRTGKKVPFTDPGIAVIEAAIRSVLRRGVNVGGLSNNPAPSVSVPLAVNVSPSDKAARTLTGVTFTATLAGALIAVKPVTGTLS
jgi:hypothetical protein